MSCVRLCRKTFAEGDPRLERCLTGCMEDADEDDSEDVVLEADGDANRRATV